VKVKQISECSLKLPEKTQSELSQVQTRMTRDVINTEETRLNPLEHTAELTSILLLEYFLVLK
jgi:hypothetical protein